MILLAALSASPSTALGFPGPCGSSSVVVVVLVLLLLLLVVVVPDGGATTPSSAAFTPFSVIAICEAV